MPRVKELLPGREPRGEIADTLILNAEQRRMQRGFVFGGKGTCVEFDFAEPVVLRTDDVLLLDDGSVVEVVAQAEALIEVRADVAVLARLAWMLGDRHVPVEILPNRIRLRRDPALEPLLTAAGGRVAMIEAPFEPEGGRTLRQRMLPPTIIITITAIMIMRTTATTVMRIGTIRAR
jgi:urease accessory protein